MEKINKLDLFGTHYEIDVAKDWNESNKDSTAYIKGRTHFNKNIRKFTLTSQNDTARLFTVGNLEHLEANVRVNALASDGSCKIDRSFNTWISRESQELTLYSYRGYHILLEFSYLGLEEDDDVLVAKVKTDVPDRTTSDSANAVRDLFNSLTFTVECALKRDTVPLNNLYIQSDIVDYSLSCDQPYFCQFPKNVTDIKINAAITFTDQNEDPYSSFETIDTYINLEYVLHLAGNSWTISGDDPTQCMNLIGFSSDERDTNGLLVYVPTPETSFPWYGSVWGNMILTFQSLNPGWFDVYMADISDETELTDFNEIPIITIPVVVAEKISKEAATLNNQIENLNLETEGLKAALYEETPKTFESSPIKLNNPVTTPLTLKTFEIKNLELFNVVPSSCVSINSTPTWGQIDWPNSGGYSERWEGDEAVPPSKNVDSEVLLDYLYHNYGWQGACEFLPATASYKNVKLLANTYSYSADLGYLTYNRDDDSVEVHLVFTNIDTQEKIYCSYPNGFVAIPTSGIYNITVEGASKEEYQPVESQTIYLKMCPTASYQSVTAAKNWVIPASITINSTKLNHQALADFARQNSIYKVNYETKQAYDILGQEYDISDKLTTSATYEIPVDTTISLTEANVDYNFIVSYKDKIEFVSNIQDGTAENSIQQLTSEAISSNSTALGLETVAGLKGFAIASADDTTQTYTVNDVISASLVGATYSIQLGSNYDSAGTITGIEVSGNSSIISVSNYITGNGLAAGAERNIWFPEHPEIGTIDLGMGAFAEGGSSRATHVYAHAEGRETKAIGKYAHAEGRETVAHYAAHAEGRHTKATGEGAHAEGNSTTAGGKHSHAEGKNSQALAEGSHAEGYQTTSTGDYSHAEGQHTVSEGKSAHAEGGSSTASGEYSHAEGYNTTANGNYAHTEGANTTASQNASHAEGFDTTAEGIGAHAEGRGTSAIKDNAHAEGLSTTASATASHAEGNSTIASGTYSHAEGSETQALSSFTHAEGVGTKAKATAAHAEGNGTVASGGSAHAEGQGPIASGQASHAEGINATTASGKASHAEGTNSKAQGDYSHAEGWAVVSSGVASHAEGQNTQARADYSHAGGQGTIASRVGQTAIGLYNKVNDNALFVIGNGTGTAESLRKNIFEVLTDGTLNTTDVNIEQTINNYIPLSYTIVNNYGIQTNEHLPLTKGKLKLHCKVGMFDGDQEILIYNDQGNGTLLADNGKRAWVDYETGFVSINYYDDVYEVLEVYDLLLCGETQIETISVANKFAEIENAQKNYYTKSEVEALIAKAINEALTFKNLNN